MNDKAANDRAACPPGGAQTAPCRLACPAGIDVPRYIRHIARGDFDAALRVIRERIPFPAVCGHACVHPCEARCARRQYEEAIAIRLLKRAAEENSAATASPEGPTPPSGKAVAVVGSGPCGLTAAYYLARLGHAVTVFEALPQAGGMLRYGIPGYRLPKEVIARDMAAIHACGVHIRTDAPIASPEKLFTEGFDAVLVAAGAWLPLKMGLEGETAPMVVDGLRFLTAVNAGERPGIGRLAAVVGGGNTAVDAARAAVRLGAEVLLVYRRSREDMPALPEETAAAEEEGVRIACMTMPVRVAAGKLVCMRTEPGPVDDSGRSRPVPVAGSEFEVACDTVILAVGQRVDAAAFGLAGNADGTIRVDGRLATSLPGVFAAGDAASGPKTIIDAIAHGRVAAAAIDRYLGGKGRIDPQAAPDACPAPPRPEPVAVPRRSGRKAPAATRVHGFEPVESGLEAPAAMAEASRCLACDLRRYTPRVDTDLCKGCGYCREICTLDVFAAADDFNRAGYRPYLARHPQRCVGCLKCVYICPDLAITLADG